MTNSKHGGDSIHEALALNYDPEQIDDYYSKWVQTYDRDVQAENYIAPQYIAGYLSRLLDRPGIEPRSASDYQLLDAGCGTGLVGLALSERAYRQIDGFDLCEAMVTQARERGVYRALVGGCDMNHELPYPDNAYDVTISCGVFTSGHVAPSVLNELARVTKVSGLLLVSTRKSYSEDVDFERACMELEQLGLVTLIDRVLDGPYIAEEGAHYWAFEVK